MSIESVVPSNHLILCYPLLLPSIFPSIRVFPNESVLRIRWPKYQSFSFNISPSKEHPGRERERWRRNRTGRSLSPSQIPQKNISMPSKLHKTTSVGWQRTSGNQKSRPLSSKTGRKKYKRRERRQRRWGGSSVREGKPVPGREF